MMQQTKNNIGIQYRRKLKSVFYGFINFFTHYRRFVQSSKCDYFRNQESFMPILIANYHVIEKCLAMPDFELGHCQERVLLVCNDLLKYRDLNFNQQHIQYQSALRAIDEYYRIHKNAGFQLSYMVEQTILKTLNGEKYESINQPFVTKELFFQDSDNSFPIFARSRHSCRAFSDEKIPMSEIFACVDLARTTPTPCNRQPNKTYVITNNDFIKQIVNMQGGGRGFAEKADKMLVITSDISMFGYTEINEAYKSGGMYTMSLLYALHSHRIGACTLQWPENKKNDIALRLLLHIPTNEEIIMLVAIGYPISKFKYVQSNRNDLTESIQIV